MIVMKTFFEGIPESLSEAAAIDGASEPVILLNVILPVSKPVMATRVLFYAVGWWNNYFNPMLYLSSTNRFPMMVKLKQMLDTAKMIEAVSYTHLGDRPPRQVDTPAPLTGRWAVSGWRASF